MSEADRKSQTPEGGTPLAGDDPVYLRDPLLDATVRMLVELAAELWVERERRLVLEARLETAGLLRGTPSDEGPDHALRERIKAERDRFIDGVFKELRRIPLLPQGNGSV
ncbi:MAG: hypothetical protein NZM12_08275 [Steroidobacteraceae bacterium]|nr:hypothetical protein [Steroidobacteraceae bacterium]MDW8257874.1 hypothetical protein [Gammaproteobacteria bacterium]